MPDSELVLFVNDQRFAGWHQISVVRSIESIAGSFNLSAVDRWADQDIPWQIREEDECRIEIDGIVVLDGFVDKRSLKLAGGLTVSGRDKAAALVDNDILLKQWTFANASVLDIARKVAAPFGIEVNVQAGLPQPPKSVKEALNPGEKAFEALHRVAKNTGVLLVSDGKGGILVTRAGARRADTPIIQGSNLLLEADVDFDMQDRYRRYVIATQVSGNELLEGIENAAPITQVRAEAFDLSVRRRDRILVIKPEKSLDGAAAKRRADWEARVRAAKAETVSVLVRGWRQPTKERALWPLNAIIGVHIPRIGVDGDMLISQVEFTVGEGGKVTKLHLVRPDAFTPEPHQQVRGEGAWNELAKGV